MPAKNRMKVYVPETYYHIYNRGVEKRGIFLDAQDYAVWQSYTQTYLLPKDIKTLTTILTSETTTTREKEKARRLLQLNNFSDTIRLHAYCLMSNHLHLLVWQSQAESIDQFMNSLGTRYTMYFNKKYKRVGPLFQGVYKAVRVISDEQLLYLTKYIHRNPHPDEGKLIISYPYSSYRVYCGIENAKWVDRSTIVSLLSQNKKHQYDRYRDFVEDRQDVETMAYVLKDTVVDL